MKQKPNFPATNQATIPAFIGYTEKAGNETADLTLVPTKITSVSDYVSVFGKGSVFKFIITIDQSSSFQERDYDIYLDVYSRYFLFSSIQLFFANGGEVCYVISIGRYGDIGKYGENPQDFVRNHEEAFLTLEKVNHANVLVMPDIVTIRDPLYGYDIQKKAIAHCQETEKYFAILDVHLPERIKENGRVGALDGEQKDIQDFQEGTYLGHDCMCWAAAYYPWLHTSLVKPEDVDFSIFLDRSLDHIANLIEQNHPGMMAEILQKLDFQPSEKERYPIRQVVQGNDPTLQGQFYRMLLKQAPFFRQLVTSLCNDYINLVPPSGAIAGLYVQQDRKTSVGNTITLEKLQQVEDISRHSSMRYTANELQYPGNGLAINAITRDFSGGVFTVSHRTLDGNSQDWKYISHIRTYIQLKAEILAAQEFILRSPRTEKAVADRITAFLEEKWRKGILVGAANHEAFQVVEVKARNNSKRKSASTRDIDIHFKIALRYPSEFVDMHIEWNR